MKRRVLHHLSGLLAPFKSDTKHTDADSAFVMLGPCVAAVKAEVVIVDNKPGSLRSPAIQPSAISDNRDSFSGYAPNLLGCVPIESFLMRKLHQPRSLPRF
jgi:hypothetical protein